MEIARPGQVPAGTDARPLRRIPIVTGLVLVVLIPAAMAVYPGALIMLAPMVP